MASTGDAHRLAVRFARDNLTLRPDEALALCAEAARLGGTNGSGADDAVTGSFVADALSGLVGVRLGTPDAGDRLNRALETQRAEAVIRADLGLSTLAALVAFALTRPQDVRPALRDHLHLIEPQMTGTVTDTGTGTVAGHMKGAVTGAGAGPDEAALLPQVAWLVGLADAWVGDLPRGVRELRVALELAGNGQPMVSALAHMLLGKALCLRGDVVEARSHLVTARELAAAGDGLELGNGHLECSAYLPLVAGDDEGFLAVLELLGSDGRGGLSGLGPEYRLELATAVALAGDRGRAKSLAEDLRGPFFAGRPVSELFRAWAEWAGDLESSVAGRRLATLATRPTDPAENLPAARITWLLGTHASRQGLRGDALRLLESAAERLTAMGALGYVRRIETELRLLVRPEGVPATSADARAGRSDAQLDGSRLDTAALTPAERRIAHAVSGGLSNREVAELLVLSERTVETHLSSIFRKLGIRNRTELAVSL